jgi:hypothetical protein
MNKEVNVTRLPYKNTTKENYGDLLLNSTFVCCPGGGSMSSYQFSKALLASAIPMDTSNFLPLFHPVLEWSGYVVLMSNNRVIDTLCIAREV